MHNEYGNSLGASVYLHYVSLLWVWSPWIIALCFDFLIPNKDQLMWPHLLLWPCFFELTFVFNTLHIMIMICGWALPKTQFAYIITTWTPFELHLSCFCHILISPFMTQPDLFILTVHWWVRHICYCSISCFCCGFAYLIMWFALLFDSIPGYELIIYMSIYVVAQ